MHTTITTLSLHDALPILRGKNTPPRKTHPMLCKKSRGCQSQALFTSAIKGYRGIFCTATGNHGALASTLSKGDRKSTRLNSSHLGISYAVFCLKKKILLTGKIILIKQELLLLVYELNRSGLLAENEKIRPILAQLEKLLLCDLSPSTNDSVKN